MRIAPRPEGQNRKRGSYSLLIICRSTIFEPSFAHYLAYLLNADNLGTARIDIVCNIYDIFDSVELMDVQCCSDI